VEEQDDVNPYVELARRWRAQRRPLNRRRIELDAADDRGVVLSPVMLQGQDMLRLLGVDIECLRLVLHLMSDKGSPISGDGSPVRDPSRQASISWRTMQEFISEAIDEMAASMRDGGRHV
jgi:hypothetical protein